MALECAITRLSDDDIHISKRFAFLRDKASATEPRAQTGRNLRNNEALFFFTKQFELESVSHATGPVDRCDVCHL
jgi:hypothetical protein